MSKQVSEVELSKIAKFIQRRALEFRIVGNQFEIAIPFKDSKTGEQGIDYVLVDANLGEIKELLGY